MLDFEAQAMHTVTVMATDPSGCVGHDNRDDRGHQQGRPAHDYRSRSGVCRRSGQGFLSRRKVTEAVATFSAEDEDEDADAGDSDWSLDGPDKKDFDISDEGELTFRKSPNFEKPTDRDEDTVCRRRSGQGRQRVQGDGGCHGRHKGRAEGRGYRDRRGGGWAAWPSSQPQPQATRDLTATLKDEDVPLENPRWQWSRGPGVDGPWDDLQGQTNRSRKPVAADIGNYLRATVSYTDQHGDQTAEGVTEKPC